MRLGILIAASLAVLLNVIVMVSLFQAAHSPLGAAPAMIGHADPASVGRGREHRSPRIWPLNPVAPTPSPAGPQYVGPVTPVRPADQPAGVPSKMALALGVAAAAAGALLLTLGVLLVLILRNGRKRPTPARVYTGMPDPRLVDPSARTNWEQSVSRFDPTWSGTAPQPHREMPPAPTLVMPDSLSGQPEPAHRNGGGTQVPGGDHAWIGLVRECVDLYEEMDRAADGSVPADHVRSRLLELLERSGVEVIENDTVFQRTRHQAQNVARMVADGTPIRQTVSPGFAVGSQVLRRATVWIAD